MARLGIEPRLPKYVSGALLLSYLALEYQTGLHLLPTYWPLFLFCYFYIIYHRMSLDGINNLKKIVKILKGWPVSSIYPHTWNFTHPYMACTWHASPFLTFQPPIYCFHLGCILIYGLYPAYVPIHGLYLACVLMPRIYLTFTVPGIVTLGMINNVFYIPAMYMGCMLANCHVPCTWPCKQLTFLLMCGSLDSPWCHRLSAKLMSSQCWLFQ
jgi:hypothetical protein